jgi:hypothetical protein
MSAEKEIVNFWYNSQGYFTLNNLKSKNRDVGIVALKFSSEKVIDACYVDVSCSISGNVSETSNVSSMVGEMVIERFEKSSIRSVLDGRNHEVPVPSDKIRKCIVLGSIPKSRKQDIISAFSERGVSVIEFEDVLSSVMKQLDTQYYRNDVIRTLQLMKYLLLSEPRKVAEMMGSTMLNSSLKEELVARLMDNKEMVKGVRHLEEDKMGEIISHSKLKNPEKLAAVLHKKVLNSKTKGVFVDTLMKQKGYKRTKAKKELSLRKFFD